MIIFAIICSVAITAEVSYMVYGSIKQMKEKMKNKNFIIYF